MAEELIMFNGLLAFLGAFLMMFFGLLIITYILTGISLYKLAKRTKTKNAFLAWIPFANIFLMTNIAKIHFLWAIVMILTFFIPVIGPFISFVISIFILWKLCEVRNKPGYISLFGIIPMFGYIGVLLYLAFSK